MVINIRMSGFSLTSFIFSPTMCMGFGCNACGVSGCRIIDSERERLIAIITNTFVPCNGRFPAMISIITIFFTAAAGKYKNLLCAVILLGVIIFGVVVTLLSSKLLSVTFLKGKPSGFVLELPPYRLPKFREIIVRSVFERTIFVLGRAVAAAAPAGAVIWLLANIQLHGSSLLSHVSDFLDPVGRFMGLDGVILIGFILGFPANEIVLPIILMGYLSEGTLVEVTEISALSQILVLNGWTWVTALCAVLFSLCHFPCATTCITIYKETKSLKWTIFSVLYPLAVGASVCALISHAINLII